MYKLVTRKICCFMCLVLFFNYSGLLGYVSDALAGTESRTERLNQIADRLERMFKALEVAESEIPRDTFDIQAIVDKVGQDPTKLFEWVRDNTYLVPYQGALRGHMGVLMDRLGNSLDRALLLYELLRGAGHEARLARATLSEEKAEEVLQKARPIPQGGVRNLEPSHKVTDDRLEEYSQKYQLNRAAEIQKVIDRMMLEQQRLTEDAVQRTFYQAKSIAAAVGRPDRKEQDEALKVAAIEAMKDHWWVEVKNDDAWVGLDPTLPDIRPGQDMAKAQETFRPNKLYDLSEDLLHMIRIRVVIEYWRKGKLNEKQVLESPLLSPTLLLGKRIALCNTPVNWPGNLNLFEEKNPVGRLKSTVLDQHEWLPTLLVEGYNPHYYYSFTDDGTIETPPVVYSEAHAKALKGYAEKMEEIADIVGRSIFGLIDKAPDYLSGGAKQDSGDDSHSEDTSRRTKPKAKPQLTAEWIEYEIHSPGQEPRKIRREIFDILGPAARSTGKAPVVNEAKRLERGLALMGETEIFPLVCQLSPEYIEYLTVKKMLANRNILPNLVRSAYTADFNTLNEQANKLTPLQGYLYNFALVRNEWSRFRDDVYLDRPNIISYHNGLRKNSQGEVVSFQGFDIVANDVAVRPGADQFMVNLEQGVLDTNAEALIAKANCPDAEDSTDCGLVENTAEIFARSKSQGIEWLTMQNIDDPVKLPDDVRARIGQDLKEGYTVLVPEKPVSLDGRDVVGWWRVNSRTGQTLGIGKNGWGQTASEGVLVIDRISIPMAKRTAKFTNCLNKSVLSGTSMNAAYSQCLLGLLGDILKSSIKGMLDYGLSNNPGYKMYKSYKGMEGKIKDPIGAAAGLVPGLGEAIALNREVKGLFNE